ncbi:MFS transporter [Halorubrum sp. JWXQ-INN 858]|uniref:MFS transporter n=1 Tax=Halorubrum sp. JWXQ-INN 858 TaxID=2690782 RepID=UPI0013591FC0|nr:MFS transporter [Halorubrum sp. JWXQ-INN 858]MWV65573.1 MFS transporter [Halorubrum sp. JWXQ-INN 858]
MHWRYRHTVLALCTFAFFATMVGRLAVSPVVPQIRADFAISNTVIGVALTGMWLSYALAQFPSGVLGDRYGERAIVLLAVGGTGVMSFLVAISPGYAVFVVCVVLLGAFAGFHYSTATALLSRTYDNIGTAIGVHTIGAPAGGLLAPIAAAWIGVRYGWRPAVAIGTAVAVPAFVLFALAVRSTEPQRPDQPMRERFQAGPVVELLSRPPILFTAVIASVGAFVWQGTASFLPTFLIEHHGLSSTTAGVLFSSYFVVQAVVKPALGWLSDGYGRDLAIAVSLGTSALGMALFVVAPGIVGIGVAVVSIGIGLGMAVTVEPRFMDELSEREQGVGFGVVRTVYLVISSLGSVVVGLLADAAGWAAAFWVLVALLVAVLCALVVNAAFDLGY